jgi:hypothetical protein
VTVLPCRSSSFRLAIKVRSETGRDPDLVLAAVENRLRATYGRSARTIGAPVFRSAVVATAMSVVGVVAVDLDRLYLSGATPLLHERLVADPAGVVAGLPVAGQLLALADGPFDWLEEMP